MTIMTQILFYCVFVFVVAIDMCQAGMYVPQCRHLTCGDPQVTGSSPKGRNKKSDPPSLQHVVWNQSLQKCECAHLPCADTFSCNANSEHPILDFVYDRNGRLECFCRAPWTPHMSSRRPERCMAHGEQVCSPPTPIMVYEENKGCLCHPHPCEGMMCEDFATPMLDFSYDQDGKLTCFCADDPCANYSCDDPQFPVSVYDQEKRCSCIKHAEL